MADDNTGPLPLDDLRAELRRLTPFDVDDFVYNHLTLRNKGPYKNGGTIWQLEQCPFDRDHVRSAAIIQGASGSVGFRCFHNSCNGKTWADVLALSPPEAPEAEEADKAEGGSAP
jgi:hypothetical protein